MQHASYGSYEGENHYSEFTDMRGQKIREDSDEQFADIVARKVKTELNHEQYMLNQQRLMLGITSVCALVVVFSVFVLVLGFAKVSEGAGIGMGWGFIALCWALFMINYFFSEAGSKQRRNGKNGKKVQGYEAETDCSA